MNIQQYYRQSAIASLNACIVSFVPPIIILLIGFLFFHRSFLFFIFMLPFFIYSFICYQAYKININRWKDLEAASTQFRSTGSLFEEEHLLLGFMPSPSLRMLFFHKGGHMVGEIRDLNQNILRWFLPYFMDKLFQKRYGFFNEDEELIAIIKKRDKRIVDVTNIDGEPIMTAEKSHVSKQWVIRFRNKSIRMDSEQLFTDILFTDSREKVVGRVRKGWMPLEWGDIFKDPNTPVFTIERGLANEEKLILFALLAMKYSYANH